MPLTVSSKLSSLHCFQQEWGWLQALPCTQGEQGPAGWCECLWFERPYRLWLLDSASMPQYNHIHVTLRDSGLYWGHPHASQVHPENKPVRIRLGHRILLYSSWLHLSSWVILSGSILKVLLLLLSWFVFCCCEETLTTSNVGRKGFL